MELYFAQLLGIYFIIIGLVVSIRRKTLMPVISELAKDKALLLVLSVVELAAGVALVLGFPKPALSLPGILSVIGYIMIIEGIMYLATPNTFIRKMIAFFNKPGVYVYGGLLSALFGMYLAAVGFGIFVR